MASHFFRNLKERADGPISERGLELMVCIALACWTFGQIVFVHSFVGGNSWVSENQIGYFHSAIAFGCLVAVLASRNFKLNPIAYILLFLLLFGALAVWRRKGDNTLLAIVLFIIAAHGMRLDRIIWWHAFSALAGIGCVVILSMFPFIQNNLVTTHEVTVFSCGFSNLMIPAYFLLGVLSSLCLAVRGRRQCILLASACFVCAIFTFVVLDVLRTAVFMLIFGAANLLCALRPKLAASISKHRLTPFVVVSLPIVLFLVGSDLANFFKLGGDLLAKGAYAHWVRTYGYVSTICLAVLFFGIALRRRVKDYRLQVFVVLAVYGLFLAFDPMPARLECNASLLLLTLGLNNPFFGETLDSKTTSQAQERELEEVAHNA